MRIIEVCSAANYGDGVGNDMLTKAEMFRELGYECEIYAGSIDARLKKEVHPLCELSVMPDDILLHHYAGYTDVVDLIKPLDCIKVLMYHNVTPPELVEKDMRESCERSLQQVSSLALLYDFFVGDSQYNVNDLCRLGVAQNGDVLPILVEFDRTLVKRKPKKKDDPINFLFVGRVVKNKMHIEIMEIFEWYYTHINRRAELYFPGDMTASPDYFREVKAKLKSLNAREHIHFLGKVSDEELREQYNKADIYLSMSRHEGFGIPLLEAMNFQIPVFAYNSSAVKDTLGSAGILLDTNKPEQVARQIDSLLKDAELKETIIARQNERLKSFSRDRIKSEMERLVEKWSSPLLTTTEERIIYQQLIQARQNCSIPAKEETITPETVVQEKNTDVQLEHWLWVMDSKRENYAFRHLYSCRKVIGRFIVFGKRVVRKLLKWYIEPICFQQTDFNIAATEAIKQISTNHAGVVSNIAMLDNRLAGAEQQGQAFMGRLAEAEQRDEAFMGRLAEAEQRDEAFMGRLAEAEQRDEAFMGRLEEAEQRDEAFMGRLAEAEQRDEAFMGRLAEAEQRGEAFMGRLAEAEQRDEAFMGRLAEAEQRDEDLMGRLSEAEQRNQIQHHQIAELTQRLEYMSAQLAATEHKLQKLDTLKLGIFEDQPDLYWERDKTSQSGEDSIVAMATGAMGIPLKEVTYLDLGANHAKHLSNTNFFYQNGARGVLVEANPRLIPELKFYRHGDIILNRCVDLESGKTVKFYVLNGDGLSTPNLSYAEECLKKSPSLEIVAEEEVETISVMDILEQYFEAAPVFVNLDIEGKELEILQSIDFDKYRPLFWCIEMIPYRPNTIVVNEKNQDIMRFMQAHGYAEYAFTGINSIFVDMGFLRRRRSNENSI